MPKFSANLSMLFTELPFLERFEAAAQAGFEGVECQFPYDYEAAALSERLQRHQLELVLHNLPAGNWASGERGIACDPARTAEFREGVDIALGYARTVGCTQLNCLVGIPPPGADAKRVQQTLIDNLRFACRRLAEAGLRLLVEPLNCFDVPGFWLNRSAQAMALLEAVGAENLFLQYDVYHMQRMEGELARTIAQLLPRIGHIQIADNPGRHQPGSGEINYPWLLRFIDELGYQGWIGCEYQPLGSTIDSLAWLHDFGR